MIAHDYDTNVPVIKPSREYGYRTGTESVAWGKPCIRGLRLTVYDILEYLASGMSEEEILHDFPDLTPDDIRACMAFAANRERELTKISA